MNYIYLKNRDWIQNSHNKLEKQVLWVINIIKKTQKNKKKLVQFLALFTKKLSATFCLQLIAI